MRILKISLAIFFSAILFMSCEDDFYLPKPKSYFRIDLPNKSYSQSKEKNLPFTFMQAKYSAIEFKKEFGKFNIVYPLVRARVHCTYFHLESMDLQALIEDCYNLAYQHNIKATAINANRFTNDSSKVHGVLYELKGNSASPIQFFMTDSTNHFLRGSLYFETKTNADSLAPVTAYLKEDIELLFSTLNWK